MTTQQYDHLIVTDLVNWIESHIDDKLLIDDVSRQSGYSKWHIQRKFKAVTGKTIASYIRNRMLTRAALALRKTDRRVLDIALSCGFDNQQTFTRMFRKRFGIAPGSYRASADASAQNFIYPI